MTDGREILSFILEATQSGQYDLSIAIKAASSASFRGILASHIQTYDNIESEAQQLASQRGWEIPQTANSLRLHKDTRLRLQLRMKRTDPKIAEFLIYYHTESMIRGIKISHMEGTYDKQINELFQKLLFSLSSHIRQMQPFL